MGATMIMVPQTVSDSWHVGTCGRGLCAGAHAGPVGTSSMRRSALAVPCDSTHTDRMAPEISNGDSDRERLYVRRMAARLARLVETYPDVTMGVMRAQFASSERKMFPAACALALHEGWIVRDGLTLRSGQQPVPEVPKAYAAALAEQVDAELTRLNRASGRQA